jgi:hypothetical protein
VEGAAAPIHSSIASTTVDVRRLSVFITAEPSTKLIDVLSKNCQALKEMLSSCEICSIFAPTSAVFGELQDTEARQELHEIKTAFESGRNAMQVFHL